MGRQTAPRLRTAPPRKLSDARTCSRSPASPGRRPRGRALSVGGVRSLVFVLGDCGGQRRVPRVGIGRRRRGLTLSVGLFLKTRGLFSFGFRNVVDAFLQRMRKGETDCCTVRRNPSRERPLLLHTLEKCRHRWSERHRTFFFFTFFTGLENHGKCGPSLYLIFPLSWSCWGFVLFCFLLQELSVRGKSCISPRGGKEMVAYSPGRRKSASSQPCQKIPSLCRRTSQKPRPLSLAAWEGGAFSSGRPAGRSEPRAVAGGKGLVVGWCLGGGRSPAGS